MFAFKQLPNTDNQQDTDDFFEWAAFYDLSFTPSYEGIKIKIDDIESAQVDPGDFIIFDSGEWFVLSEKEYNKKYGV